MSRLQASVPAFPFTLPSSLAVVADDTTGACDVGGALAAWGLEAVVELADPVVRAHPTGVPVRAVEVREACAKRASDEMAAAFAKMAGRGRSAFVLKIDSTFRGQIAHMLSGALVGSGRKAALVAPAFPAQGRTIVNGYFTMTTNGQVTRIEIGPLLHQDESSYLRLSESDLAMPELQLLAQVTDQLARGKRVLIADATSQRAVDASARLWLALWESTLLVGSAGIAAAVAACWQQRVAQESSSPVEVLPRHPVPGRVTADASSCDRLLVVLGSPAAENSAQIGQLRTLLGRHMDEPADASARAWPVGQRHVRVLSSLGGRSFAAERDAGYSSSALASRAARHVGQYVPDCAVIVGGFTARRVLDSVGATAIDMIGEIVPGLPTGRVVGGQWNGVRLVTKAGSYGGTATLSAAILALRGLVET